MHFTLVLLFCSLIHVSIGAGEPNSATGGKKAQQGFSPGKWVARQPGQIVGVRPADVKNIKIRSDDTTVHPAVFVDIIGKTARVVMMSNHFVVHIVPLHLRGDVRHYFPTKGTNSKTDDRSLTGALDFCKYREVDINDIRHFDHAPKTIMSQDMFEQMKSIIDINKEHRENRIAPLGAPSPSKFAPDQFGSIKKGQIIMINPWNSDEEAHTGKTYLGIFVSWIGDGMLAIVPVLDQLESTKKADIATYDFIPPDRKVIGSKLVYESLNGEINLEDYTYVSYKDLIYPLVYKTIMQRRSYRNLREAIDKNIKMRTTRMNNANAGALEEGRGKRPSWHGPSSAKGEPASKRPRPDSTA